MLAPYGVLHAFSRLSFPVLTNHLPGDTKCTKENTSTSNYRHDSHFIHRKTETKTERQRQRESESESERARELTGVPALRGARVDSPQEANCRERTQLSCRCSWYLSGLVT